MKDFTDLEKRLIHNLSWMCMQYLSNNFEDFEQVEHKFMSAGEGSLKTLQELGFATTEDNYSYRIYSEKVNSLEY